MPENLNNQSAHPLADFLPDPLTFFCLGFML